MLASRHQQYKHARTATKSTCPTCFALHTAQTPNNRQCTRLKTRVANPRHDSATDNQSQGTDSWDEDVTKTEHHVSDTAPDIDWAKAQSLAFLAGASSLVAVVAIQLTGTADLQGMAYDSIPEALQEALPQLGEDKNKGPLSQFSLAVQNFKLPVRTHACRSTSYLCHQLAC